MSALVHRCLQLETTVPLKVNPRGLVAVKLADVIAAFKREHPCPNLENVTTVTTETQQQAQQLSYSNGVAGVAQRPAISDCQGDAISVKSVVLHGDAEGQQFASGSASALSRRSISDLYDRECGRTGVPSTGNDHPASVGQHGPPRGKTQEQEFHGRGGMRRLQENGIQPKLTARDSHWHLGRTEVHGSIIKRILDRMDQAEPIKSPDVFRENLIQAVCANNTLSRIKGYTEAVLGISRRLPESITSDTSQGCHAL